MNSVLLQIASRYVRFLLVVFALIALLRGHNYPGGGFIGGLLAGISIVYAGFASSVRTVQAQMHVQPLHYLVLGLSIALASALPGLFWAESVMQGIWVNIPLPFDLSLKLGTPFVFDVGVFLVVIGVMTRSMFSLNQREE